MIRLRSTRSTSAPATGPNRMDGSILATITPATAYAPPLPPSLATSETTATNPTQSPIEETVCAASRRGNGGRVRRSLKLADRVPRSCATSSARLDTYPSAADSATAPTIVPQPVHFVVPSFCCTMSEPQLGQGSGTGRWPTVKSHSG